MKLIWAPPFDDMVPEAYRSCDTLSDEIQRQRQILEQAFMDSANRIGMDFLPLPAEWWDFRFPSHIYRKHEAISDADLPPQMQMTNKVESGVEDFDQEHFDKIAKEIINKVDENS